MRPIHWVASTKKDLRGFPEPVKDVIGRSLLDVQFGDKPQNARPLRGFGGAGVLEIIEDHDGATYRAVYTVKFADAVYVLHCFQKKSKRGIATPRHDIELIRERLAAAELDWKQRRGEVN
jgi:phage-related protein